jgi:hypothetical protein
VSALMPWLDVPYLPQVEPGGCLPACAAMVLAHLGQPAFEELSMVLSTGSPVIVFVRTSELPYWHEDTAHALVLVGLDDTFAYVLDPAYPSEIPVSVEIGDFALAWSYFEQAYALIRIR